MRTLLVLALACAGCAAAPRSEPDRSPLRVLVASDLDNAPFAYVDERGRPAGRDVEMMERLAEHAGLELAWQRLPFEDLLPAAQQGVVDVVCATLGVTPERERRVLFTRPYFETSIALVVRRGPGEPQRLADLRGRRVAAGAGTTSERAVRERLSEASGVFENMAGLDAAERLARREVDAVALDGPAADALVARGDGALRRLPGDLAPERYALALPKDRLQLRGRLDAALQALSAELAQLDARYGLGSGGERR